MQGTIIKGIAGFYYVKVEDLVIECKARGKFRYDELTPIVGDKVNITVKNNKGVIEKVLPRTSELTRPLVANVSQAFIIFSIKNPDVNLDLLNKFLVFCEYNKLKIVICINKIDLATKEERAYYTEYFIKLGYEVEFINAKLGEGISELEKRLSDNVTVLCGPSGVGKSTLLNKISGKDLMKTGEISDKIKRGKHTTRHSELIEVNYGFLVDTPGFSNIDITFIDREELKYCFPDFKELNENCRFTGCVHNKEPNCAIKNAVESGQISVERYNFYIKTLEESNSGRNKKW